MQTLIRDITGTEANAWLGPELTQLFESHGLATPEGNTGLTCKATQLGGWRVFPVACEQLQGVIGDYSGLALFGAYTVGTGAKITNFVSSWFPFMHDWWRKLLRQQKGRVLESLPALDKALAFIAEHLSAELATLDIADTATNRCALLNLYVARGSRNLANAHQKGFPPGAIEWLRVGVHIEHVLYFFSDLGGWNRSSGKPAAEIADALEMGGIPLRTVATLYPAQ